MRKGKAEMKKYLKRVYGNECIVKEWLSEDEQKEVKDGLVSYGAVRFIAEQRKSNAEFWLSGFIALSIFSIGFSLKCLFEYLF